MLQGLPAGAASAWGSPMSRQSAAERGASMELPWTGPPPRPHRIAGVSPNSHSHNQCLMFVPTSPQNYPTRALKTAWSMSQSFVGRQLGLERGLFDTPNLILR
jgi:hypothetical protein